MTSEYRNAALRGNYNTHRNAGLTNRVREALDRESMTAEKLSQELDVTLATIKGCLRMLTDVTGGACKMREGRKIVYHSYQRLKAERDRVAAPVEGKGPYAMATRMERGRGFRWFV
jgi:hypothetical protein